MKRIDSLTHWAIESWLGKSYKIATCSLGERVLGCHPECSWACRPLVEMKVAVILSPFASLRVNSAEDLQFRSATN